MNAPKLSKFPKSQYVFSDIWDYLDELGVEEVRHYYEGFPKEPDYNLVQYGEMRIYYDEIRELYARAGYAGFNDVYKRGTKRGEPKLSDTRVWEWYRNDVGYVVREYLKHN